MSRSMGAPTHVGVSAVRDTGVRMQLTSGVLLSVAAHAFVLAALVWWGRGDDTPMPPSYRVRLVGAPPGPRQAGVVNARETPSTARREVAGAERVPDPPKAAPTAAKALPKTSPKATPSTVKSREAGRAAATAAPKAPAAPRAGAGAEGGKGADVANVDLKGVAFPYQAYLDRIVRQLALNWSPRRRGAALASEIRFMIQRDGSVTAIEVLKRSGDGIYDLDAMAAVEGVGSVRGFGPLPSGWQDDVLVVYFTFDYSLRPSP